MMTVPKNDNAGVESGGVSAPRNEHIDILPAKPAASKLPSFVIEVLPTPLRESATVVQIMLRFDAKHPLPDDVAAQVIATLNRAKNRALTADCMTPGARAFWECPHE